MEKSIKAINRKYLVCYIVVNILVFCYFIKLEITIPSIIDPKNMIFIGLYAVAIILEGIISSDFKAILIFFRFKNPLPGSRSFSEIVPKDSRIDINILKSKYFPLGLPTEPEEQNKEWYKIYKQFSSLSTVFEAQKYFLLTRDLVVLSLILIPISIVGYIIFGIEVSSILIHLSFLVIVIILGIIACRNYGDRFVANVLAEAVNKNPEK